MLIDYTPIHISLTSIFSQVMKLGLWRINPDEETID